MSVGPTEPGDGAPRPPDRQRGGALPAPWGVSGTLLGLAATFSLWILIGGIAQPFLDGASIAEQPLLVRYVLVFAMQSVFLVVPLAALALTRATVGAVGLRGTDTRGLVEALACGALLFALTWIYDVAGARFMPELAARALEEQEQQLGVLAGPALLLWLVAVGIVPLFEEIFFRGFVFVGLRGRFDFALASGLSAAIFALSHGMPFSIPPLFAVGLGMAVLYERHRSVVPCAVAHAAFNLLSLMATTID